MKWFAARVGDRVAGKQLRGARRIDFESDRGIDYAVIAGWRFKYLWGDVWERIE